MSRTGRAQANLLALAVAIVLVVSVTTIGLGVVSGAFDRATREPQERRVAVALADWVVDPSSPLTNAPNSIDREAIRGLRNGTLALPGWVPDGMAVAIRLDDATVLDAKRTSDGTRVRRLVLVEEFVAESTSIRLDGDRTVRTLDNRTDRIAIDFTEVRGRVTTVRVNGRVRLHAQDGLRGTHSVTTPRTRPARIAIESDPGSSGRVVITAVHWSADPATLVVSVDG